MSKGVLTKTSSEKHKSTDGGAPEPADVERDDGDAVTGKAYASATSSGDRGATGGRGRLGGATISVAQLGIGLLVTALVAAVCVLGVLLSSESGTVSDMKAADAGRERAEKVALDYAVGAADMNFNDLAGWNQRLTAGTTPELAQKLSQAATSMEQVITPLQWISTSKPLASVVQSESNGVYVVNAFVSVLTKNSQAPDGVQSTATYTITVDRNNDWKIADVGGVDGALGQK